MQIVDLKVIFAVAVFFTGVLGAVMLPVISVAWYVLKSIFGI